MPDRASNAGYQAAEQFFREVVQHVELTKRMRILLTGPLETTHIGTFTLASIRSLLQSPQARYQTGAPLPQVNVLGIGLDHRHALFFTDDVMIS